VWCAEIVLEAFGQLALIQPNWHNYEALADSALYFSQNLG
jgi:hypothetical protein